jgi:hypothetical protein
LASSSLAKRSRPPAKITGAMDHIGIAHPFSPRLEIGPAIDDRRSRAERNAIARRRHPGTARLVQIMAGRRVAHGFIGLGGLLDLAGEIDFVLEVGGRDFRAILLGEQKPNPSVSRSIIWRFLAAARWKRLTRPQPRSSMSRSSALKGKSAKRSLQTALTVCSAGFGGGGASRVRRSPV